MSARCVCQHIKALHADGVCMARIRPCGCRSYLPDDGTEPFSGAIPKDPYEGFYAGKQYKLEETA